MTLDEWRKGIWDNFHQLVRIEYHKSGHYVAYEVKSGFTRGEWHGVADWFIESRDDEK